MEDVDEPPAFVNGPVPFLTVVPLETPVGFHVYKVGVSLFHLLFCKLLASFSFSSVICLSNDRHFSSMKKRFD